jgi:hypothetical protein
MLEVEHVFKLCLPDPDRDRDAVFGLRKQQQ